MFLTLRNHWYLNEGCDGGELGEKGKPSEESAIFSITAIYGGTSKGFRLKAEG
jgi:hypothetical protein